MSEPTDYKKTSYGMTPMTPTQANALINVINTQEGLQEAWNHPRTFRLSDASSIQVHVVTAVAEHQDGHLVWSTAARLLNPKKGKYKTLDSWMLFEQTKVSMILMSELSGVGDPSTDEPFSILHLNSVHLTRHLTAAETALTEQGRDAILGKVNGEPKKAPAFITSKKDAGALLDKIQADLEKPNLN